MKSSVKMRGENEIACVRDIAKLQYCIACSPGLLGDDERSGELPALQRRFTINSGDSCQIEMC